MLNITKILLKLLKIIPLAPGPIEMYKLLKFIPAKCWQIMLNFVPV